MNVHIHQARQHELVGEINDRDVSGHICRIGKSIFDARNSRALNNYRLIVFRCVAGHRKQRACMDDGRMLIGDCVCGE